MLEKEKLFKLIITEIIEILRTKLNDAAKLKAICKLLKNQVSYYNWVGFYAVDKEKTDELELVSFEGEPTEHVRIPFGKGICGQAASLQRVFVAQDVSMETNYLSCSSKVKSEIVIPIFRNNLIVGELDIDSHFASPFTLHDKKYLTIIAQMVSELF
jgi:L-methionine (R)-S-oxide reductase